MKDLTYTQAGGFAEFDGKEDGVLGEEESVELRRLGFSSLWEIGICDTHTRAMGYERDDQAMPYLVTVWDACYGTRIYVPDAASMFALRLKLASLIQTDCLTQDLAEVLQAVKRYFRAEHGHDALSACDVCDPDEMRDARRQRAAHEERKRAAAKQA